MKNKFPITIIACMIASLGFHMEASAQTVSQTTVQSVLGTLPLTTGSRYRSPMVLIQFKTDADIALADLSRQTGLVFRKATKLGHQAYAVQVLGKQGQRIETALADIQQLIASVLKSHPAILAFEWDSVVKPSASAIADKAFLENRFAYDVRQQGRPDPRIGEAIHYYADTAKQNAEGHDVVVAVLDTGIYKRHIDFANRIVGELNMVDSHSSSRNYTREIIRDAYDYPSSECGSDSSATSIRYHGTAVAGLLLAAADGKAGLGIAPNAKLLAARVIDSCGGFLSDIIGGLRWSAGLDIGLAGVVYPSRPASVINLSLGSSSVSCGKVLQLTLDELSLKNIIVLAAAGNSGSATLDSPANCSRHIIPVGAYDDATGNVASFSNYSSSKSSIFAPGVALASTFPYSRLDENNTSPGWRLSFSGTSAAAPVAAGVAALAKRIKPNLTGDEFAALASGSTAGFSNRQFCGSAGCTQGPIDAALVLGKIAGLTSEQIEQRRQQYRALDPFESGANQPGGELNPSTGSQLRAPADGHILTYLPPQFFFTEFVSVKGTGATDPSTASLTLGNGDQVSVSSGQLTYSKRSAAKMPFTAQFEVSGKNPELSRDIITKLYEVRWFSDDYATITLVSHIGQNGAATYVAPVVASDELPDTGNPNHRQCGAFNHNAILYDPKPVQVNQTCTPSQTGGAAGGGGAGSPGGAGSTGGGTDSGTGGGVTGESGQSSNPGSNAGSDTGAGGGGETSFAGLLLMFLGMLALRRRQD